MEDMKMGISFRSIRDNNLLGLVLIYPDGQSRTVIMAEMPMDADFRADVEFYDEIENAYRKRLRKALRR